MSVAFDGAEATGAGGLTVIFTPTSWLRLSTELFATIASESEPKKFEAGT